MFVENYVDADIFLKQLEHDLASSEEVTTKFQRQFEKLVVLDYIIRNTGELIVVERLDRRIRLMNQVCLIRRNIDRGTR